MQSFYTAPYGFTNEQMTVFVLLLEMVNNSCIENMEWIGKRNSFRFHSCLSRPELDRVIVRIRELCLTVDDQIVATFIPSSDHGGELVVSRPATIEEALDLVHAAA